MTKEEYEKLLKSDYWKGYSYSLIKERNFTCADCGRQFLNERNKLQVHHLVYRDVNPWSYRPDEVVVLCEECHKRRHGINVIIVQTQPLQTHYFQKVILMAELTSMEIVQIEDINKQHSTEPSSNLDMCFIFYCSLLSFHIC